MLLKRVFGKPEKFSMYYKQILYEIDSLGIGSLWLIAIISVFMGGVITIQSAYNFTSPFIPLYAVGLGTRESIVLEFSPTIVSLILAGKVGSNIASEIGTMRISEQIDALEIMGINSAGYLILPKVVAAMFINPFLITISMFLGVLGGYIMGVASGACTSYEYIFGIQSFFIPFNIYYSLTKTVIFAFIITSVSAYHGYYTTGGALEVGKASTRSVVYNSILILVANLVITQLMLV
ncbi:MAG: mlaE [Bacteroidetes bacterium]|jgi:phospholipid/cholesterol/gamma-HCH transport system permease protein|nr:mlaE [Bacteroidota bacterium]